MAFGSQLAISSLIFLISIVIGKLPLPIHSRLTSRNMYSIARHRFSVEIVHRYSTWSPLHEYNSTLSSRLISAYKRSYARGRHFNAAMQRHPSHSDDLQYSMISGTCDYLVKVGLGKETNIYAMVDPGSDLSWFQCKPCVGCSQDVVPLFDPTSSARFYYNSKPCSLLQQRSRSLDSMCQYSYSYMDGSIIEGILSSDKIMFDSMAGYQPSFDAIFGCTHRNNGSFEQQGAGLIGLGGGKLSFVRQFGLEFGNKFSYCLPSDNPSIAKGRITFGWGAFDAFKSKGVVTTPLIRRFPSTFYFVNLEGIEVAGSLIAVMPKPSAGVSLTQGNTIMDFGTTLILLDTNTLDSIKNKVNSVVKYPQVKDPNGLFNLCFNVPNAGNKLPDITFRFAGNANIVMTSSNAFIKSSDNIRCLAIVSNEEIGVNVFGNIGQRDFLISYDLKKMELSWVPNKCTKK